MHALRRCGHGHHRAAADYQSLRQINETLGERVEERTRERDRTWELSRDLLAVTELDMLPVALNPFWENALGWSYSELMQRPLTQLVHPDDLQATLEENANVGRGKVTNRFVNRMRHRDGSYRWLSWSAVADGGRIYSAARDITSEIAAVDKLAEANRELRAQIQERERVEATLQQMQRLEAVGQLTAGVAHDFNNLLTVILTSASLLKNDLEQGAPLERSLRRLQYIRESGERGATLTGQLLAFARRQQLAPTAIDLNDTPGQPAQPAEEHARRQRQHRDRYPGGHLACAGRPDPDRDDHSHGDQRPRCHGRRWPADAGYAQRGGHRAGAAG